MKLHKATVFAGIVLAIVALSAMRFLPWASTDEPSNPAPVASVADQNPAPALAAEEDSVVAEPMTIPELPAVFSAPISEARRRVTKKPFGLEIIPGQSPVENDRFSGFHVGVDFETFEHEQDSDVEVWAVCDGPLILKGFAKGYGGVAVQSCDLEGEKVSVIYGHLNKDSIRFGFQQPIRAGQTIGVLGKGYSEETDGVRKHLHLGIRDDSKIISTTESATDEPAEERADIRGYVKDAEEIKRWRNILDYIGT